MPKSIGDIKNSLDCQLGNRIVLKANGGRKKQLNVAEYSLRLIRQCSL